MCPEGDERSEEHLCLTSESPQGGDERLHKKGRMVRTVHLRGKKNRRICDQGPPQITTVSYKQQGQGPWEKFISRFCNK